MTSSLPAAPAIEAAILALTEARGPERSICPSEVARALREGEPAEPWQPLMTPVRQAAARLARSGRIDILRKGKPIDPADMKGVIRLRTTGGGVIRLRTTGAA